VKVRFYCDVYPGQYPKYSLTAVTQPYGEKFKTNTRLAFDVVIPDSILSSVDVVSPEPAAMTVIAGPDHD
jgi:hypothetical protein